MMQWDMAYIDELGQARFVVEGTLEKIVINSHPAAKLAIYSQGLVSFLQ